MVAKVRLTYDGSILPLPESTLILGAPCKLNHQLDLMTELQRPDPRLDILANDRSIIADVPKVMGRYFVPLNGVELEEAFAIWVSALAVSDHVVDEVMRYLPTGPRRWYDLPLEKKVIAFAGTAMASGPTSFCFLGDIYLERNSQLFLVNSLTALARASGHSPILLWSFHLVVPQSLPFYFHGFERHAD